MKNDSAIRHKIKQVKFRHLKKEIENLLKPLPNNCSNNITGEKFCRCGLQDQPILICDNKYHGDKVAESCPNFTPIYNKDKIKESLNNFFINSSVPDIAKRYPDMAALLWTLDSPENRDWVVGEETTDPPSQPLVQLNLPLPPKPKTLKNKLYDIFLWLGVIAPPER